MFRAREVVVARRFHRGNPNAAATTSGRKTPLRQQDWRAALAMALSSQLRIVTGVGLTPEWDRNASGTEAMIANPRQPDLPNPIASPENVIEISALWITRRQRHFRYSTWVRRGNFRPGVDQKGSLPVRQGDAITWIDHRDWPGYTYNRNARGVAFWAGPRYGLGVDRHAAGAAAAERELHGMPDYVRQPAPVLLLRVAHVA